MITKEKLQQFLPNNKNIDTVLPSINKMLDKYKINTKYRIAGFLSQLGHESSDLTRLSENLNYKAERLLVVFPKYFKDLATAKNYERNPQKIGNRVYGNRMGNGDETTGDGFKFHGRGGFQLTGKNNYTAFAASVNMTIDEVVEYCETMDGAIESACWFWNSNKLNDIADKNDIVLLTKRINGGTIGLDDRTSRYQKILANL